MAERVVRYIITGDSAGAVKAMKATEVAAGKAGEGLERTGSKLKSLGSGMSSFGHKLSALSLPLLAVGGYSIKAAMDFQTSMTQIQTQAGASASEVNKMSSAVLKLAPKVGEGPSELAAALYPIESVGLRGSKALQALTASSKGAQIGGSGLVETANAMAGALRVQMRDTKSASGAMSIMDGIVGLGKMHLAELTEAMGTGVLTSAKQAGLGFRDVGAALDAMTRQNIPAQVEATRMRLTLTQMTAPTGIAKRALKSLGLGQFSLANDLRKPQGLIVAMRDLRAHLAGLSKDQQDLDLSEAFGKSKGSANVIGLLNALPEMENVRNKLSSYNDKTLNSKFSTRAANASFKMQQALAAGKAALISFGQTLIPVVIPALTKFSKIVIGGIEWLKRMPKPLKDVVVEFTLLLAVGGPLLIFFGNMIGAVGSVISLLGKLGPAMATANAETGGAGLAGTLAKLGGGFKYLATEIALPVAALTAMLWLLQHIHTPKWLEREGKGQSGRGKPKSLLESAASAAPWAPKGTIAEAGLTPKEERESLQRLYRSQVHPGVSSLAALAAAGMGPSSPAAAAATARSTEMTKVDLHVEGRLFAEAIVPHLRNNMTLVKPIAEGVTKYAQSKAPR
ncbi:MAG TPA: phage tail tape measure protein [Reyranella sp.]|nr:phage tail tape measure protein [Reyranella sp.]